MSSKRPRLVSEAPIVRSSRSRHVISDDDDEEDGDPPAKRRKASDNFIDLGSGNETSEGSDVVRSAVRRRPAITSSPPPIHVLSSDEGEDEDDDASDDLPRSSKRSRHVSTAEELQELQDEVEDLKSSSGTVYVNEAPRSAQKESTKSKRQRDLERYKKQRAGFSDEVDHDELSPEPDEILDDSDDMDEVQLPGSSARDMFIAEEADNDFIADDGDDTLGQPDGVPLEFTRYASMKPKELFKFAVEWMVHRRFNPKFNKADEIYDLAFRKLNDEAKGLAGSEYESSVWQTNFKLALRARPDFVAVPFQPNLLQDRCEACGRTGHPPSFQVQFQGRPYYEQTLTNVDQSDEDEHRDVSGKTLVSESHCFLVGSECTANAEMAHWLQHWRNNLYGQVVQYLEFSGRESSELRKERRKWDETERRNHANTIVDEMIEEGAVRKLYKDFKAGIEEARLGKQGRKGKRSGGRSRGNGVAWA
ncbi:hypothetical protein ANO11243_086610 [Dothideomycetidae sp. 11243]|nr:hypothetical protein ANO11243_086610 [fungal sp. No.11243]